MRRKINCSAGKTTTTKPAARSSVSAKRPVMPGRPRLYKTASERQAAYRARARRGEGGIALNTDDPGQGARRVDLFLPTSAALALRRLARHKGVSQAQIVADLITKADHQATKSMDDEVMAEYINEGAHVRHLTRRGILKSRM